MFKRFAHLFTVSNFINLFFYTFIIFAIIQRAPSFIRMYKSEGKNAPNATVTSLNGQNLQIPLSKSHALIFWATWCGPCNIELNRINKLIINNEIPADSVIAVSTGEDLNTVSSFAKTHDFRFNIATDLSGTAAHLYNVSATPTILLIEKMGQIYWMTMGLSPSLEFRLKSFLNL